MTRALTHGSECCCSLKRLQSRDSCDDVCMWARIVSRCICVHARQAPGPRPRRQACDALVGIPAAWQQSRPPRRLPLPGLNLRISSYLELGSSSGGAVTKPPGSSSNSTDVPVSRVTSFVGLDHER